MSDDSAILTIDVDAKSALAALKSIEINGQETAEAIHGAFESLSGVGEALVAALAIEKIAEFFGEGITLASQYETSLALLGQQMKLTGEYTDEGVSQFSEFADQLEKTTKFSDQMVISQLAVAKSFGISNDQAEKLVTAATELASATRESLDTAVEQLGKTFDGVIARSPTLKNALHGVSEEGLRAGEGIDAVIKNLGGSAQAEINTYGGAIIQAGNALEQFRKAIGFIITDNPTAIAAIKGFTDILGILKTSVNDNKDKFSDLLTQSIKVFIQLMPLAAEAAGPFIKSVESIAIVGGIAANTLVELDSAAEGFLQQLAHGGMVPVVSEKQKQLDALADSIAVMTSDAADAFDGLNKGYDQFSANLTLAVNKVLEGDAKVKKSATDTQQGRKRDLDAMTAAQLAAYQKLLDDADKFEHQIAVDSFSDIQKVEDKKDEQLTKLEDFFHQGIIDEDDYWVDERRIVQKAQDDIGVILQKSYDDQAAKAKAAADKIKSDAESASANPIKFILTPNDPDNPDTTNQQVGAGLGAINDVLGGADGAKKFVADTAGAISDLILPGIGGAVSALVATLAQGPKAVEALVRGFVAAVPDIITAVAQAAPALVDALVDSLILKGGIVKIAIALGKALTGVTELEYIGESIGKQIGVSFGSSLNSSNISQTISAGFKRDLDIFGAALATMPGKILAGFNNGFAAIEKFLTDLPSAFSQGGKDLASSVSSGIGDAITSIGTGITNVFSPIEGFFTSFFQGFQGFFTAIEQALSPLVSGIESLFQTPGWIQDLENAISSLTNFKLPGTGGGGGGVGGELGSLGKKLGFASGITSIPSGYPDDSLRGYGLSSGERVVDPDANSDLKDFLASAKEGGFGGANTQVLANLMLRVAKAVEGNQSADVTLKLDGQVLSKQILNLNRQNARLA